jgi:glycosyltransferase involved in cell wall biosynthesis
VSKLSIVHLISGLSTGGAERALYNLLRGGLTKRFDCSVISLRDKGSYGDRIDALGVPVNTLEMHRTKGLFTAAFRLRGIISRLRPQIVQGWMYHGNLAATFASYISSYRTAVVWNIRHSLYDISAEKKSMQYVIRGNKTFSSRANAIIYNSSMSKIQHESYGFAKCDGRVIPNGFDLRELAFNKEIRHGVRSRLGIGAREFVIGHVARFHPMKDHAGFLRSAVLLAQRDRSVCFLLLGRDVNLANPALAGIVPPEFENRFIALGERTDAYEVMQAMDILCCSSAWGEAFPNVLGEAMALGIPCVATDVGDSAEIIGNTGRIVPPSDVEALANSMLEMLAMSQEQRMLLGSSARSRVETKYDLSDIVTQYGELYKTLSKKKA